MRIAIRPSNPRQKRTPALGILDQDIKPGKARSYLALDPPPPPAPPLSPTRPWGDSDGKDVYAFEIRAPECRSGVSVAGARGGVLPARRT